MNIGPWQSDISSVPPEYRDLLQRRFQVPLPEKGPDKRVSLREAVARNIRPYMSLHIGSTHTRPYAFVHELIRQFWKKNASLEISCVTLGESWVGLYTGGMMRRAITTFAGDMWPYPSPNPAINRAWLSRLVKIEHWSILSMTTRLLAGALGLPFLPTRSLLGSSIAKDNFRRGHFQELNDPFGRGDRVGLVSAYRPKLCVMHVPACDISGNAILTPPLAEGALGAFAARKGVILTTERIVPTSYLRAHSHMVKIPAEIVTAVVEVPFGGHPRGQTNLGIPEFDQYADDYAFMYDVRQAARKSEEALQSWIDEWILSVPNHEAFLAKLGNDRLEALKSKADGDSWPAELEAAATGTKGPNQIPGDLSPDTSAYLASEMTVVAASRKLQELAKKLRLKHVLAGVGAANLSAWLALHALRDEGVPFETLAEIGYLGYEPRPGDPYIFNFKNTPTCLATSDILTVLGMVVGGGGNLGSLGAAQVDKFGNINTTCIPGVSHLLGSGGSNDVASLSEAVVVTAYLGHNKFKERVDYVTSPGDSVRAVVTDQALFTKVPGPNELILTGYYSDGPTGFESPEQAVEAIKVQVGWKLRVARPLEAIGPPTPEELRLLRLYDPYHQFLR